MQILAFVSLFLALPEADEQFRATIHEIQFQRDEGHALGASGDGELSYFPPVRQQHSGAYRIMLSVRTGRGVFGDVHSMDTKREWRLLGPDIPFAQAHLPGPDRFDFRAGEFQAAFKGVGDGVVVPSPSVLDDRLVGRIFFLLGHRGEC